MSFPPPRSCDHPAVLKLIHQGAAAEPNSSPFLLPRRAPRRPADGFSGKGGCDGRRFNNPVQERGARFSFLC